MLHWGNLHLKASNFGSFVSLAAIMAAILDFMKIKFGDILRFLVKGK